MYLKMNLFITRFGKHDSQKIVRVMNNIYEQDKSFQDTKDEEKDLD